MSWLFSSLPSIPGWSSSVPTIAASEKQPVSSGDMPGGFSPAGEEDDEEYDDTPPQFPLPESAQRSTAPASLALAVPSLAVPAPSFALAPPSPTTSTRSASPPSDLNIAIVDAPLGDMRLPHSTTARPTFGIKAGGGLVADKSAAGKGTMPPPLPPAISLNSRDSVPSASNSLKPTPSRAIATPAKLADGSSLTAAPMKKKGRGKVALAPGHSALDWARLTKSGTNLRGFHGPPKRVTMEELKKHKTEDDAWSAFNGVVYNITPYLNFHPGGVDELMRVAGRDGTKLFMLTHSWVNIEHLMQECMVGMLVRA
ncbi:hypothetical protein CcaverHIS002_0500350 [Cutaneotrichosporon cavernicola]|uniref:Cytochrome b5 heme-binding domain-containing protein n=1 Tax=Cutaneotrichosporon cavernicola TaxID=279322 RepID=A0AA48L7M1_9TREE|nr:uncharacterized protein CcaverHIS019_0600350 [Cutaneotrichosporon cavernicola]BEI84634.1 hypothetical protein CcaverHIS002_0500350 [Cutaneotrichosporon cavernicola]BEI93576.1 hypothetical protein CcaverHIS019_0600350 [Cutaneotrichosporon cavernicola]BEJ01353.1 hypothetical protein CcaverHIS631_0600350 [Cutaneotrichosporon cavernicola]BEJ09120.1 hypothetical protein CcaverHIS641_0600350 [Cutaneotrichosporon cavernicola]